MDQYHTTKVLLLLVIVAMGAKACQEPSKGILFLRENQEDDILLSIESTNEVASHWSVKGLASGQSYQELEGHLVMKQEGSFWNLVTTKGMSIPMAAKRNSLFKFNLELACQDKQKEVSKQREANVYTVNIAVFPQQFLQKVLVTVPENTPVHEFIYHDREKISSAQPTEYKHFQTKGTFGSDASHFFELNKSTGSVTLVKTLDYEKDPKIMWFLTTKETYYKKVRLFVIRIGNVNDNAPEFRASENCHEGPECRVTHYEFTARENGPLSTENKHQKIYAVDPDGDTITYAIKEASPKQNLFKIDTHTGELRSQGIDFNQPTRLFFTVQASDGLHESSASVVIKVVENTEWKNIMQQIEMMHPVPEVPLSKVELKQHLPSWLMSGQFKTVGKTDGKSQMNRPTEDSNEKTIDQTRLDESSTKDSKFRDRWQKDLKIDSTKHSDKKELEQTKINIGSTKDSNVKELEQTKMNIGSTKDSNEKELEQTKMNIGSTKNSILKALDPTRINIGSSKDPKKKIFAGSITDPTMNNEDNSYKDNQTIRFLRSTLLPATELDGQKQTTDAKNESYVERKLSTKEHFLYLHLLCAKLAKALQTPKKPAPLGPGNATVGERSMRFNSTEALQTPTKPAPLGPGNATLGERSMRFNSTETMSDREEMNNFTLTVERAIEVSLLKEEGYHDLEDVEEAKAICKEFVKEFIKKKNSARTDRKDQSSSGYPLHTMTSILVVCVLSSVLFLA